MSDTALINSRALIDALRRQECYAHPVRALQVRETHISWVILTGEYAYKIKKPVRLKFLDFFTLERRRHYCEEELRLNQRFAPALYCEVVPITGSMDAPRMGGAGEPIEFAVKLRQFDGSQELSGLLEHSHVTHEELWRFGSDLAHVHAASTVYRSDRAATDAWETVAQNSRELRPRDGDPSEALAQWLQQEHKRLEPILTRRGLEGHVRECHGDLHASNVVRWQGALTAFDCIEFSPALRQIDVANDVAFLMMDLAARGHPALAYAFLNGWLEGSGDYEAITLLRWFRVHRALVRSKVEQLGGQTARAENYLQAAKGTVLPATPQLIVMCGLSGSGKTWMSTKLLHEMGGVRVRSDVERKRLAGLQANESSRSLPGEGIYTVAFNDRVYAHLLASARTALAAGERVIVDAAFLRRHERMRFISLAQELNVPLTIIHCRAPNAELHTRLQARQGDASEATVAVLEQQAGYWEEFDSAERNHVVDVNTSEPQSVQQLVGVLRNVHR